MTDRDEGRTEEPLSEDAIEAARYVIATAEWISGEVDEDPEMEAKIAHGAKVIHALLDSVPDEPNLFRAEPSGDVGEEELARFMYDTAFPNRWESWPNVRDYWVECARTVLARLRRTPETEALKKLRYVDSPLWSHDGSCRYCAVGFYALGSEHDDGCPAGAILTMYPRTKWDEARDDATQDPNAGGEDE